MEWINELVSLVVGLVGGYALKVIVDKRRSQIRQRDVSANASDKSTVQAGNIVGGDMAGRDLRK